MVAVPRVGPNLDWQRDALCREHRDVDFFASPPEPARAVCEQCLVQRECLAYALDEHIPDGVFGATSGPQRIVLRKRGVTGELVPGPAL
jgi:Transcription factor WhiB